MKEGSLDDKMSRFLFKYRITPHTSTGISPAELLQGRKLRSRLDLVRPDVEARVMQKQEAQKKSHDKTAGSRDFQKGERVYARNFSQTGPKWITGTISEITGPVSFKVKLENGVTVKRHQDQVRKCYLKDSREPQDLDEDCEPNQGRDCLHDSDTESVEDSDGHTTANEPSVEEDDSVSNETPATEANSPVVDPIPQDNPTKSYPSRNRRKPEYYGR